MWCSTGCKSSINRQYIFHVLFYSDGGPDQPARRLVSDFLFSKKACRHVVWVIHLFQMPWLVAPPLLIRGRHFISTRHLSFTEKWFPSKLPPYAESRLQHINGGKALPSCFWHVFQLTHSPFLFFREILNYNMIYCIDFPLCGLRKSFFALRYHESADCSSFL